MLSNKYIFPALTFLALALVSCHKDLPANSNPVNTGSNINMSLQFNGNTYTATGITAVDSIGKLQLAGVLNNSASIYLAAPGGFQVGNYPIASGGAAATFTMGSTGVYNATSGAVAVTAVNGTTITGTFNFITTNAAGDTTGTVTNGVFQTTYISK